MYKEYKNKIEGNKMISLISLVTSVKDYIEVVHKLIESDSNYSITNYYELGSIITYGLISMKNSIIDFFSLNWLKTIWNLPLIIPEVSSSMISEISVLDGYFHNTFNFLDTPLSYGQQNGFIYGLEKFVIGLINSCFFFIPTSAAHIITLRRFVMQGIEAGYIAGVGTIAGNIFWIGSIVLGCRFFVIPWLSLDIFRYLLGFMLLVKYMWDSYNERRSVLEDLSKQKIFLFSFLLSLTEQTSIYPFLTNISLGPESSILESFPAENYPQFMYIHICYLLGLLLGSFSLLHFSCWFWENPAFKLYMWVISWSNTQLKVNTSVYYKFINFGFLYLTMICAITSIPYYGLDYTITNPLGLVNDDRIIDQKLIPETAFINTKASDKNTRRNRGRHGRRERWKRRVRKYRTFDASLYDQGVYDLFTIEDLNYGFDRFWYRRKMRNHRVRFRFFPGPWMRSFKKQLAKPRLESYAGPRQEFFRILFEQVYHPNFHKYNTFNKGKGTAKVLTTTGSDSQKHSIQQSIYNPISTGALSGQTSLIKANPTSLQNSTLRKFVRKINNRIKTSEIINSLNTNATNVNSNTKDQNIYSKRWKQVFSPGGNPIGTYSKTNPQSWFGLSSGGQNFYSNVGLVQNALPPLGKKGGESLYNDMPDIWSNSINKQTGSNVPVGKLASKESLPEGKTNAANQILQYKSILTGNKSSGNNVDKLVTSNVLLHPLKYYLKKEQAFERKLHYYTPSVFRKFSVENNAPYFRVMMKRYFYYYKPSLRWEKTMKVGSLRKARRKTNRIPRKLAGGTFENPSINTTNMMAQTTSSPSLEKDTLNNDTSLTGALISNRMGLKGPTSNYTVVGKRASRYRYQIYKDVLQHWYYSPFNRFLVKLDVDSFIRRQPNSHFLTKNEENLIHLRRFLLSEHYNTLRWYTYMQNYRSMKTQIGGTKSFSSRVYNQQFQGTFKKIRHLFAITPSLTGSTMPGKYNAELGTWENGDQKGNKSNTSSNLIGLDNSKTVLKFDQPLYNEPLASNSSILGKNNLPSGGNGATNNSYLNSILIHEELFDTSPVGANGGFLEGTNSNNLVEQSTNIIREYLKNAAPIRQEIIQKLINDRNYTELTQFLYKGQKTRGIEPITSNKSLLNQEQQYLLTNKEKEEIKEFEKAQFQNFLRNELSNKFKQDLWVNLLKNWKHKVNDQEFLKNYLSRRMEKREKRQKKKAKAIKEKLARLSNWYVFNLDNSSPQRGGKNEQNSVMALNNYDQTTTGNSVLLSSGTQKAIIDGVSKLNNRTLGDKASLNPQTRSLWKAQTLYKIAQQPDTLTKTKTSQVIRASLNPQDKKLNLNNLRFYSQIQKEKEILASLKTINNILMEKETASTPSSLSSTKLSAVGLKNKTKAVLLKFSGSIKNVASSISSNKEIENLLGIKKVLKLFKPLKHKSLTHWQKRERALNKQKKSRKEFKSLSKKYSKKWNVSDLTFNSNTNDTLRKKRASSDLVWENQLNGSRTSDASPTGGGILSFSFLNKQFKRKKSPQRRARIRRNHGPIKKRTLADSLKREFRNLRKYKASPEGLSDTNASRSEAKNQKIYSVALTKLNQIWGFGGGAPLTDVQKTNFESNQSVEFNPLGQKQRRLKQRKQRTWKQKRAKYSQKLRKYKKRRRNIKGQIRILSKQLKRIKSKIQIQNWWWNNYLPNIRANTDALWQLEKEQQIKEKLDQLSIPEMLKRDSSTLTDKGALDLQIGDKDFKPLALPEAMRIKQQSDLNKGANALNSKLPSSFPAAQTILNDTNNTNAINATTQSDALGQMYENLLLQNSSNPNVTNQAFLSPTTSIPFYAGWDEALRKFVVTNRLLSRREAGFSMTQPNKLAQLDSPNGKKENATIAQTMIPGLKPLSTIWEDKSNGEGSALKNTLEFTSAPLKGMNAATTLYWQIPFTTYDPDQFFALGMDGFAPIGWRRFNFRHTILKSWLYHLSFNGSSIFNNKNSVPSGDGNTSTISQSNVQQKNAEVPKAQPIIVPFGQKSSVSSEIKNANLISKLSTTNRDSNGFFSSDFNSDKSAANKAAKNQARRLKKRYRRVKKHPRAPVWFPSGPLLNQVLPVHYIYVFYKRSRLPRDRYIKRRLNKFKNISTGTSNNVNLADLNINNFDFTLRKRVKTKRKYHRKKEVNKNLTIFPRRVKFYGNAMAPTGETLNVSDTQRDSVMWRPMSRNKLSKPISQIVSEQRAIRNKQRQKDAKSTNKQPSVRVKQLRRRVQRQIIRTVWRYRPRAGGFVWPGDYLRLELVKAPKLQLKSNQTILDTTKATALNEAVSDTTKSTQKSKRKKKRALQEWQIQPKKYLLEKHNLSVLKKKLEKANRLAKLKERTKEINYLTQSNNF